MLFIFYVLNSFISRQSLFNRLIGNFVQDKTIPQGAATTIYGCVCPRVGTEGMRGAYLSDCGEIAPNEIAHDANKTLRNALWEVTEKQLDEAVAKL